MQALYIILITIIPIALWGGYFYVKNPRKQPLGEILKIFWLGTLSIIPVIWFHQYVLDNLTHFMGDFLGVGSFSIALSLLQLVLLVSFILLFILIFALIQSIFLVINHQIHWGQSFKANLKKMYNLTPLILFFILFVLVELVAKWGFEIDFILSLAGSTILFAVLEEYFKYIINPFLVYKKLNSIGSAVVNAVYVGLAFAFIENILFFLSSHGGSDFMLVFAYRSVFTTLLHVCASGILGYFYGLSLFSKSIITNYEIEKSQYSTLASLRALLGVRKKSVFQSVSISQGFFVAATIHAVFNGLIYLNLIMIAGVLSLILASFIVYLLNLESTQVQYGLIGTREMPEEDFEQLRLKISVLQHVKDIQSSQKNV